MATMELFLTPANCNTGNHVEIKMKHKTFVAVSYRGICALGAFVLLAGTSAALAQSPAAPADKSATKAPPAAVTQPVPTEKKDSMMPGMPGMSAGVGDMRGSMMGMMKDMETMKMTGDTDRDFAAMMKVHHQGAIDMSQIELQNGKDPKMRAMAKRIIDAQKKEIKEFEQWLGTHK
jgi:uncharacterized protein (DUF305 family)